MTLPPQYTSGLSKKDKKKQLKNLKTAKSSYKRGKYVPRPKLKSFKEKKTKIYYPHKYYKGLSFKESKQRYTRIKNNMKLPPNDKKAYKPFKTDYRNGHKIKTKTSNYTEKFKKKFPTANSLKDKSKVTGVPLSDLKKVYNKGLAAWRTGHRPGATGQQWAYARVHSFLMKGKTFYTADSKIAKDSIKKSSKSRKWFNSIK